MLIYTIWHCEFLSIHYMGTYIQSYRVSKNHNRYTRWRILQLWKALFSEKILWVKKKDEDFDVPVGCYDSAEVCKIVESYIWD